MLRIMFVCHGNICRSPMAEFVFREMVKKRGLGDKVSATSAATHDDALGCGVHRNSQRILSRLGISTDGKVATKLRRDDYDKYDLFIGMDGWNIVDMQRLFDGDGDNKVRGMLEFCRLTRDVDDPWYTGDYEAAYSDINNGCSALLDYLIKEYKL